MRSCAWPTGAICMTSAERPRPHDRSVAESRHQDSAASARDARGRTDRGATPITRSAATTSPLPPRAFISYSHADAAFAARLADALPGLGIEPWIDREGIAAGVRWSRAIQDALDSVDVLVLILSPTSMASTNVADEWQYALDRGKPVLPVLHEPTDVHFQLGRLQYVDFRGQPFEVALPQLADGIGRALVVLAESIEDDMLDDAARARAAHAVRVIGPPSGTVTFLFTDIEGSTALWETHPTGMRDALARLNALLQAAIGSNAGYVFKTVGDAVRASFRTATGALAAAADAQRALADEDWSTYGAGFPQVQVRMAVHTGECRVREGDYFGAPVNRVARIESVAAGGHILLSAATERLVREQLPEGAQLRDLGEHRLRDLRFSEHIYQLVAPGQATPGPDLRDAPHPLRSTEVGETLAQTVSVLAHIGALTPQRLRQALASIRRGAPVEDEDLLDLGLVRARQTARGLGPTPEHRSEALAELLHDLIRERLFALRGATAPSARSAKSAPGGAGREEALRLLRADFAAGHREREAWAVLYARFVGAADVRMQEMPELLSVGRSTLGRRLKSGLHALAMELRRREAEHAAQPAPSREPVQAHGQAKAAADAAAEAAAQPQGNLPARRDLFVGRGDDLARIGRMLERSRLVTLVGPGGVGKTRLAVEAARRLHATWPDGVWLLELAGLQDEESVPPALAALLEITEGAGEALAERIARRLRPRRTLLIFDNCEHLLDAAADLADRLLDACPDLTILATSRVALEVAGESRWRVEPLGRPADPRSATHGAPVSDSEQLLIDRLQARRPGFRPGMADSEAVRRICERLDGLPLALELAAARAGSIPLPTLAELIDARPAVVRGGARGLPERHRSIGASIDWSYRLLSQREQAVFESLSVFAGGFTLEAAEAVCAGRHGPGRPVVDRLEMLDLLSGLVEQSLLLPPEPDGPDLRYRMLHALRSDGRRRSRAHGEGPQAELELRHARHYRDLARRAGDALSDARQSDWVRRLDRERENLLAAIDAFRRHDRVPEALSLAAALRHYWSIKGALTEGRRLLEGLLDEADRASDSGQDQDVALRLAALEGAGHLARRQSDYASARRRLEAGLALARGEDDRAAEARLLRLLGHLADEEGRTFEAEQLYRRALSICRERDDAWGEAALLNNLGLLELNQGHVAEATTLLEESLLRFRRLDEHWAVGIVLLNQGNAAFDAGELDIARGHYLESLEIVEALGDRAGIAAAQSALAKLAVREGAFDQARDFFRRAIRELLELEDLQKIAEWLEARAVLDHATDRTRRSCRLLAAAERLREEIGAPLLAKAADEHAALDAAHRDALGETAHAHAQRRGAAWPWRDAVADAMD